VGVAFRELIFDLAAIIEDAHDDQSVLDRVMRLGQRSLGALGLTLGELADGDAPGSRIVAATGASTWALGRPIGPDVVKGSLLPNPAPYALSLDILEDLAIAQLKAWGIGSVQVHPIYIHGRAALILAAFFATDKQVLDADQTAVMKLLASCIGYLHRLQAPARLRSMAGIDERELFMAVTSHELRTPVTVIKGYAETLRDHWDRLTEPQRIESARVIGQRASELARMVDRLLEASTAGESMSSHLAPFDLLETLRKAAADLPGYLRKRLQINLPHELPPALGHRGGLASVLVELVTNAHKYSPGSAQIVLSADSDQRTVLFRVADRGIGISADRAANTFERFWQGDAGDDRRYGGAGLGLFLVRKTIERQNGWVSLRPRDGGGTVAEVRLPRGDIGVGEA
jgi:signal transduction histidine kinase